MAPDRADVSVPGPALDLSQPRRVHIVGVAGAGMSAIALVLARMGHAVSGSDIKSAGVLERLAAAGVEVHVGNHADYVPVNADAVVYSTAIPPRNVELVAAAERGIPVLHRSAALAALAATRKTIAVAGSHGKTTSASMLALILRSAGWSPSFVIGGEVNEVGSNAAFGEGEWLVVEADESDGTFLHLAPQAALVTNIEPDHLDHYGDFAALVRAFEQFVDSVDGPVVTSADDEVAARVARAHPAVRTYGFAAGAHYRIVDEVVDARGCRFTLVVDDDERTEIAVPAGVKASTNAAGSIAIALELGVEVEAAVSALAGFGGVARRFQHRGERDGVTYIDDYAHLPTEVGSAIAAARQGPWKRVIVVFQPHRYSRTASIGREFADSFTEADTLVLTDVYPAGETPIPGVSGRLILRAVLDRHPSLPVAYLPRPADLVAVPKRYAHPGDLVLTLGAGDLTAMPDVWLGEGA
ncbi:MAG TPA: UDP-N-acetylmuramate--L-alanine ligase [Acidimicrobiia bacterium]|nr:UDP-N-acetylmuramate--L-alanine ligase [Acidimicrobiia bacterium]